MADRGIVKSGWGKRLPVGDAGWLDGLDEPRVRLADFIPHTLAGVAMVAGFAMMGMLSGKNFTAPGIPAHLADVVTPAAIANVPSLSDTRGPLLSLQEDLIVEEQSQQVMAAAKGDYLMPTPQPRVITAAYVPDTQSETQAETAPEAPRGNAPSIAELERNFARAAKAKREAGSQRKFQLAEKSCLARAVYFEARSESELGQMAVAQVILNRVRDPAYPKTICGVVYQGAHRPNSCQFSFACDGEPDQPTTRKQWAMAQQIAQRAMDGNNVQIVAAATHYHADYVKPKWSNSLRKIVQIGRHIFYTDS